MGSTCSGIGVCHRAATLVGAANEHISIKPAFVCDTGKSARKVLLADFPGVQLFGDVGRDMFRLPSCDILVAGFPCQPFSQANRRRKGMGDPRCSIASSILSYVERVGPKLVVLENVPGILSFGKEVIHDIVYRLQAARYEVAMHQLWSHTHGGVPQRRCRLYLVAISAPQCPLEWPAAIPMRSLPSILDAAPCEPRARPTARKAATKIDRVEAQLLIHQVSDAERAFMVVNCHSQLGQLFMEATPCLTSARGAQGGFWLLGQHRMMSVGELLRLQGLDPSSTRIASVVSKRQAGSLLGNSFTLPVMARVLVSAFRCMGCTVVDPVAAP